MSSVSRPAGVGTSTVLCFSWNDDGSALAVGTTEGFLVYSTEQGLFAEVASRRIVGGVGHIALYQRSNVVLFSGHDEVRQRVAFLWDDSTADAPSAADIPLVADVTLPTTIVALRLHHWAIVIAEETVIRIFNDELQEVCKYRTPAALAELGSGLRAHSVLDSSVALATEPLDGALSALVVAEEVGSVWCLRITERRGPQASTVTGTLLKPHSRPVRCLAITADGKIGATISENGTALKLLDLKRGEVGRQLNRGSTPNAVHSMAFTPNAALLACLSESGTVHCFAVAPDSNPRSKIGAMSQRAVSYAPAGLGRYKWVQDAATYAASEYAVATYSVKSESGASVTDDVEQEVNEYLSNTFAAIALRVVDGSRYHLVIVQGNSDDPTAAASSCKFSRVEVNLHTRQCHRERTNFFPREEL